MSRSQKILAFVAAATGSVDFDAICHAAGVKGTAKRAHVSAQLAQMVAAGKLKRTGEPRAFRYAKTKFTLVDRRKFDDKGRPRNRTALKRNSAKAEKAAAAKAVRLVARKLERAAQKPLPHQHLVITPAPLAPTATPRRHVQRETVDEFLARGGRIQHLANGEVSRPLKLNSLNAQQKRRRKAPATTTD